MIRWEDRFEVGRLECWWDNWVFEMTGWGWFIVGVAITELVWKRIALPI